MRTEIEGRPILGILAAFILGLSVALHPINLLAVIPLPFVWRAAPVRIALALALIVGVILGARPAPGLSSDIYINDAVTVQSIPRIHKGQISFEATARNYRFLVYLKGRPELSYAARVHLTGIGTPLRSGSAKFQEIRGIQGTLFADKYAILAPAPPLHLWADQWRRSFDTFARSAMPEPLADVASALCFNMDRLLDDALVEQLQATGTIHIVSVSGLHIVVLTLSLMWSLSYVPIPRVLRLVIAALALSFYALATGLNPPTVRAVLMALIGLVAYTCKREPDWLSALAASGILFLIWKPGAIYDIGFQLSYVTVAAFCMFLAPDRDLPKPPLSEWIAKTQELGSAGLVASFVSAPLVAYHFGRFSIIGVVANVLIAAPVAAVIVVSFVAHFISLLFPTVAKAVMQWLVGSWIGYLYEVLDTLSAPSWAAIDWPGFSAYVMLPFYIGCILGWRVRVRRA